MKKVFIVVTIFLISGKCFSQFSLEFGGGISYQKVEVPDDGPKNMLLPLEKLSLSYEVSNIVMEGEMRISVTRIANAPKNVGGRIGYDFGGFIPAVGYYYNGCSSDHPELNFSGFGYFLKYVSFITDQGAIYFEGAYVNKSAQLTAGIHFEF